MIKEGCGRWRSREEGQGGGIKSGLIGWAVFWSLALKQSETLKKFKAE